MALRPPCFSVCNAQWLAESITAELKAGKSDALCDAGKLIVERELPGLAVTTEFIELQRQWTGSYIFGNDTMSLTPVVAR